MAALRCKPSDLPTRIDANERKPVGASGAGQNVRTNTSKGAGNGAGRDAPSQRADAYNLPATPLSRL